MTDVDQRFYLPTPAAAFFAVADAAEVPVRRFLAALMREAGSRPADMATLMRWTGLQDPAQVRAFIEQLLSRGWLVSHEQSPALPGGSLEEELPRLLPALSSEHRVLLADTLGFAVFDQGFEAERVEELAALSADLANLHRRRAAAVEHQMGVAGAAWALVSPRGDSRLGFWPLHIADQRFVLVMGGQPLFDQPQLVDFVILLHRRLEL